MTAHGRRRFLKTLAGGAAATAVSKAAHASTKPHSGSTTDIGRLLADLPVDDERYWKLVKDQFSLRPNLILMNAANLCPSPYPVIEAVRSLTADVDTDASFHNRAKFAELKEACRAKLAAYLSADSNEIAITRNTSEGNNTVVNGLTLGPGDEVVIWDQNHPTNNVAWDVRAERYGFRVVRVTTPRSPQTSEELLQRFVDALNSRTRVLAFSHVSNISGTAAPAKELCRLARERDILTLVDGAQTFGALKVDLHDMGCDFYTGSSHKWFVGPKEAGILYVRRDRIEGLWPSNVGVGWASALENGAQKFENLGQRDDAAVSAMGTAGDFHGAIGADRIEARVRALAGGVKRALSERFPNARFHTPLAPKLSAGVVVFALPGVATRDLYNALYSEHRIGCAAMGGEFDGIRLSPHIYNTMDEIDRVIHAIALLV